MEPTTTDAGTDADEIETILRVLDEGQVFQAARQIEALYQLHPDNPDVVGLKVRAEAVVALKRYERDGGQLPVEPGDSAFTSYLVEAETALRPFSPLEDTNELALGRALFVLLKDGPIAAESSLLTALNERHTADSAEELTLASKVAKSWLRAPAVAAVATSTRGDQPSALFAKIEDITLSTPLEELKPVLAHVVGRELLNRPNDILREAGADLVEHAYDSSGNNITSELYADAVDAVLIRQQAEGRPSRVAERAQKLRDHAPLFPQLRLDLAALVAAAANSEAPREIRDAWIRLGETADKGRASLAEIANLISQTDEPDEASISQISNALASVEYSMRMLGALVYIVDSRLEMACEALEADDSFEGPSQVATRLGLLRSAQLDAGRFVELGNTVDRLASLDIGQVAAAQEVDDAIAIVDNHLAGLQWLRRFDEAEELVAGLFPSGEIEDLERKIPIAVSRIDDADDVAGQTRQARRLIEHMLERLDAEEYREPLPDRPITKAHVRRRTRRRWLRRGYYRLLAGELDAAEAACTTSTELYGEGEDPEPAESEMRDAIDAVIAMQRGDLNTVETIAARQHSRVTLTGPTQRLIASVAALESGRLLQARGELSQLCRERPGYLPAMVAYSNVLLILAATPSPDPSPASKLATAPETDASLSSKVAATSRTDVSPTLEVAASALNELDAPSRALLEAADVLHALQACVAANGRGFSAVPSRSTKQYIMASSAFLELRFAVHEWKDRRGSRAHIKAAEKFLEDARSEGVDTPDISALDLALGELRRASHRRRPRTWQIAVGVALVAVVCLVWVNKHRVIDGGAVATLTLTLLAVGGVSVFFPWLRKLTIGGVELDTSALGRAPQVMVPQFDRDLLVTMSRTQLLDQLVSALGTSVKNITLAGGRRTIAPSELPGEASTGVTVSDTRQAEKVLGRAPSTDRTSSRAG